MYPISLKYKDKIKNLDRVFKSNVQIQHSTGVLNLSDVDIVGGTIVYTESSQTGEDFTIGSTVASDLSIEIINKPEYANINFMGATIIVDVGLLLEEEKDIETYFLQAPQPSELDEGANQELWESVPLGRFNVDDVNKQRNTITLKTIDNMINLDKSYSLSNLSYPATLYQIYTNICNQCDVQIGTTDFPNKDYIVSIRPDEDATFRDILGYVAELSGTFAKVNRTGALELLWYKPSGVTITSANRFDLKASDSLVRIKGVMATVDNNTYLAGTDEYAIDLTDNPLLQGGYETVLPNIFNNIKDTVFTPFTSDWQGNPAIQAGDIITQIDRDGNEFTTLVTKSIYKYRGKSTLEGKGLPEVAKGFKGSTNKKIANIIRKVEKEVVDKISTLEQLQLNATELIANMLGGYAFYEADAFYVADSPVLANAQKVWKWGIGGFGYSENGIDGPYNTGITADGTIVAMLIAANIITADMVQTGMLQSEDGSTWVNLDDGSFNFKNQLVWDKANNKLTLGSGVKLSWGNVTDQPTILSGTDVTTITNSTISTTNVVAQNLQVKSANITGVLSANQITTNISQVADTLYVGNGDTNGRLILKNGSYIESNNYGSVGIGMTIGSAYMHLSAVDVTLGYASSGFISFIGNVDLSTATSVSWGSNAPVATFG